MKKKIDTTNQPGSQEGKVYLMGYPLYPVSEDIYSKGEKEENIDPEDISNSKNPNEHGTMGTNNQENYKDDISGNNLDVPGSELDDKQEEIGSEDEENNYYSLGLDNHNDLEENWE